MFDKIIIFIMFFILWGGKVNATSTDKIIRLERVNVISKQLLEIANLRLTLVKQGKKIDDAKLTKTVKQLLSKENDPDVLARVALISKIYMYPGNAEEQVVDNVFDEAVRDCIKQIESLGGLPAIDALESIERQTLLDGGFSLYFKESLQRLKTKWGKED